MATINLKINLNAKRDPTKVYVRFKGNNFDCEAPTEFLIHKKDWSQPKQKLKATFSTDDSRNQLNENLADLKTEIFRSYNEDNHKGIKINTLWLKERIKLFHNKPTSSVEDSKKFLTAFADKFTKDAEHKVNIRNGEKLKKRTLQDYQNSCNKLKAYEEFTGIKLKLNDIDLLFHRNFTDYLRSSEFLGENTIGGVIDNIKAFLRDAERLGYKVNSIYKTREFYSPSSKTKDIYLNENEIQKIKNHEFEFDSYLDNARDWLIIGVWTGLRVSDLLLLTINDIVNDFIDNVNFKTDIPVAIPLHPDVKTTLNKRNGNFPRPISDQNFNDYIKEVAKQAGLTESVFGSKTIEMKDENDNPILDKEGNKIHRKKNGKYPKHELVTTHICRRSFATNLYGTIDTLTIMKIIGHSTEKQFLDYIKTTPKQHAEKLSKLWAEKYK